MAGVNGLERTLLDDFSAGAQLDVAPQLIDRRGSRLIRNGLLNDDGSVYERGGTIQKTNARLPGGVRFMWEGWLNPGRRTLLANDDDFYALGADDETPINLGGDGLHLPRTARVVQDLLFIPSAPGGIAKIWGGSRKAAPYSTGTITVTQGSKVVTGTGTAFLANVDPGMLLRRSGERVYVVASVDADDQLTLRDAYENATAAGAAYTLKALEQATTPYLTSTIYGAVADRLILVEENNIVRFSPRSNPHAYATNDFHELDEGLDITALEALGTDLTVFSTQGYHLIRNMAYELVDPLGSLQQGEDHVNLDLVAWGQAGISSFRGALLVPALDGIYLVDGISQPVPISKGITPRYRDYVRLGYRPGAARVYRDHYMLPILATDGTWRDLLVCRLDRPTRIREQTYFPWTWFAGTGAALTSLVVRIPDSDGDIPGLLGGCVDGFVLDCSRYLEPGVDVKTDHDGSLHNLDIVFRAIATGPPPSINRVRRMRAIYELEADPVDAPVLSGFIGGGIRDVSVPEWGTMVWGDFVWESADTAEFEPVYGADGPGPTADADHDGYDYFAAVRCRYASPRLRSSGPVGKLTIRSVELFTASGGHVRHSKVR